MAYISALLMVLGLVTSSSSAFDGVAVADRVVDHLLGRRPSREQIPISAEAPLRWIAPSLLRLDGSEPPGRPLLAWSNQFVSFPTVVVCQGDRELGRKRLLRPAAGFSGFRQACSRKPVRAEERSPSVSDGDLSSLAAGGAAQAIAPPGRGCPV
jgi:hypothetical protein